MTSIVDITIRATDQSDSGLRATRRNVEGVEDAAKELGSTWATATDQVREGSEEAADATREMGDAAEDASDGASEGFGGLGKAAAAGMAVAAAAVAGVTAAVAVFADKLSQAMDIEKGRSRLAAQLGLTAEESQHYGQMAGDLYSQAYGDSLDDVNEALRYVTQNIGAGVGAGDDALQNTTAKVMDLADAFDQDLGPLARAAGTMVKAGIAGDAAEALDVLTVGFQHGADAGEDMLDTFTEYSGLFADLGIGAEKAMGMISQAMKAGARDSDFVADAIKEFGIRSKDASDTSIQAFQALGLNGQQMTKTFAVGGVEADKAMGTVIQRLKAMNDPVAQNATAVALFGTKAEDLGSALYAIDPTTAVASLGQVEGAASRMGTTLADNASTKLEAFKRGMQQGLTDFMTNTILPGVVSTVENIGAAMGPPLDSARRAWDTFVAALQGEGKAPEWMQPIVDAVTNIQNKFNEFKPQLEDFYNNVLKKLEEAWPTIRDALISFYETALVPFMTLVGENSEQLKNFAVMLGLVAAVIVGGMVVAFVAAVAAIALLVAAGIGLIILLQRLIQIVWDVFNNVRDALGWAIDKVEEVIQWFWDLAQNIGSAIADAARWVWSLAVKVMEMKDSVVAKIGEIVQWFLGLPGRIRDAIGDLGSLLVDSGRRLLEGLWNGISERVGWLKDKVSGVLGGIRNLFPFSPAKEGPFSGRGYTTYSGAALMEGLAEGVESARGRAYGAVSSALGGVQSATGAAALAGAGGGGGASVVIHVQGSIRSDRDLVMLVRDELTNLGFAG